MTDALTQGDVAMMVSNARGLASLGMAGGYDEVLYELADALDGLFEQLEAAQEKLGWYERTQWVRRLKEERDRADAAVDKLNDIATREWRDEGGRIAAAIARDGLTVTNLANLPITEERPRDAGTSGATT